MYTKIKNFLLDTPEKYWVVVFGRHLHKSFWGLISIVTGWLIGWQALTGFIFIALGGLMVVFSIAGHRHTNNRPMFKLWDKYKP